LFIESSATLIAESAVVSPAPAALLRQRSSARCFCSLAVSMRRCAERRSLSAVFSLAARSWKRYEARLPRARLPGPPLLACKLGLEALQLIDQLGKAAFELGRPRRTSRRRRDQLAVDDVVGWSP
jgi:hypothetical protein